MPWPKARWRLSGRAMSRRSGSGKRAGSRFAAPTRIRTRCPFAIRRPPISTVSRATRARPAEPLSAVGRHAYEAACGGEVRRPGPELRAVLGRHAEQFGDDDGGQGKSEVGDEVQATCFGGAVEELVDDRLNAGA